MKKLSIAIGCLFLLGAFAYVIEAQFTLILGSPPRRTSRYNVIPGHPAQNGFHRTILAKPWAENLSWLPDQPKAYPPPYWTGWPWAIFDLLAITYLVTMGVMMIKSPLGRRT